jgi:hypothetical protein
MSADAGDASEFHQKRQRDQVCTPGIYCWTQYGMLLCCFMRTVRLFNSQLYENNGSLKVIYIEASIMQLICKLLWLLSLENLSLLTLCIMHQHSDALFSMLY